MNTARRYLPAAAVGIVLGLAAAPSVFAGDDSPAYADSPAYLDSPAQPCDDDQALLTDLLPPNQSGVEDGLALLPPLLSATVHHLEELVGHVDEALDVEGLLDTTLENEVHTVNCRLVVPVEDLVDTLLPKP